MISIELRGQVRRLFYIEHMTVNAISELLKIHHDTVRRAIESQKFCNKRFRTNILEPWKDYIQESLSLYPQIKAPRMTQLLQDRGYKGSVSSVRTYLRTIKRRINKAYLRLENFPSEQAQVDWADFGKIEVEGGHRRLSCFVLVLSYSRAMFARFSYDQTQESLLSYHIEAFDTFKGVARTILYDNMKSVVTERQGEHIKFNRHLLELASHYRFAPKACQPYAGNQKGRVERTIRYIRDNFFMARTFRNLDDLNEQFYSWQKDIANQRPWPGNHDKIVHEAFLEEQGALIPLPEHRFDPSRIVVLRSGKMPYICFDGNHYSIPPHLVGLPLTLRATPQEISIYDDNQNIVKHQRSWAKRQYIEDPSHIEALYEQKKAHSNYKNRSTLTSKLPQAALLLPLWMHRGENLGKSSQKLLALLESYGEKAVTQAIVQAVAKNAPGVDSISYILSSEQQAIPRFISPTLPAHLKSIEIKSHDPSQYDLLTTNQDKANGTNDGT